MAQTPDQTQREIEEARARIAEAAEELEERLDEATDWKRLVSKYPLESIAIVFGAAFILSAGLVSRFSRGPRASEQVVKAGANTINWARPVLTSALSALATNYVRRRFQQSQ